MPGTNRFAQRLDELSHHDRDLAARAVRAAKSTFVDFADKPGSEYYKAAGSTAADTWERVTEELARVAVIAALEGQRDAELSPDDVELIHQAIFEPVFGSGSARFRGKDEAVTYPVVLGTRTRPIEGQARGVRHKQIRRRLKDALNDFALGAEHLARLNADGTAVLRDAVVPPVKLYARIIRIHPFVDGNGRTAWAVISYAMRRCGLPLVVLTPTPETRWALGSAIRSDSRQDFEPLVDIVEDTIKASAG